MGAAPAAANEIPESATMLTLWSDQRGFPVDSIPMEWAEEMPTAAEVDWQWTETGSVGRRTGIMACPPEAELLSDCNSTTGSNNTSGSASGVSTLEPPPFSAWDGHHAVGWAVYAGGTGAPLWVQMSIYTSVRPVLVANESHPDGRLITIDPNGTSGPWRVGYWEDGSPKASSDAVHIGDNLYQTVIGTGGDLGRLMSVYRVSGSFRQIFHLSFWHTHDLFDLGESPTLAVPEIPDSSTPFDPETPGGTQPGDGESDDDGILAALSKLWNWFSNIDDWVKGLFTASTDTKSAFSDRQDDLMSRAPFVWVDAPISWLDSVVNHPCYGGPNPCEDHWSPFSYTPDGGDSWQSVTISRGEHPADAETTAMGQWRTFTRPFAATFLYGAMFIGLGSMVWRRLMPGSGA